MRDRHPGIPTVASVSAMTSEFPTDPRAGAVVVTGVEGGIGRSLARRLAERGDRVVALDGSVTDLTDAVAVRRAIEAGAAESPLTRVVHCWFDPTAFVAAPVTAFDDDAWDRAAERSMRAAFVVLQQVHALLVDGARVAMVLPTVATTGVADLVPLCTAVEANRVMAKAVARRWGARSITLNSIEVTLEAFLLGDEPSDAVVVPAVPVLGVAALPESDAVTDVLGLLDLLATPEATALTGGLLVADRGTVLQP